MWLQRALHYHALVTFI